MSSSDEPRRRVVRPMLACPPKSLEDIILPAYVQPKLDGIRMIVVDGRAQARSGKLLANRNLQALVSSGLYDGFDGELIVGDPTAGDAYRKTASVVNSHHGNIEDLRFWTFDRVLDDVPFHARQVSVDVIKLLLDLEFVKVVETTLVANLEDLRTLEVHYLREGYEGIIVRHRTGLYKAGRSTPKQQYLLKVKRFQDEEAEVIGFVELMHNENAAKINNFGLTERSAHQEHKVPGNTLGALQVRWQDKEFQIGSGFTASERRWIWRNQSEVLGKFVKFKYLDIGIKDKPRHPIFLGFRDPTDM